MFFEFFSFIDELFWGYFAFAIIIVFGLFLTFKTKFFQIRIIPQILKTLCSFVGKKNNDTRGIHPIRAFFASVGGMLGIGNIVGIATAIQIGGPGALFWVWISGILGQNGLLEQNDR